jgi:hypothetical protein
VFKLRRCSIKGHLKLLPSFPNTWYGYGKLRFGFRDKGSILEYDKAISKGTQFSYKIALAIVMD